MYRVPMKQRTLDALRKNPRWKEVYEEDIEVTDRSVDRDEDDSTPHPAKLTEEQLKKLRKGED